MDELAGETDHGANGLLIEWFGHRAERAGETFGNLLGIGGQEDDSDAVVADQPLRNSRPRHAVEEVNVDQGQIGSLAGCDGSGQRQFELHRQEGLIFDDDDPKVWKLGHH